MVQFQLFLEQVAQPVDQLALERVLGCGHGARGIAAQLLGDGGAVGLHDQLAQHPGVLILPSQHVEQRCPQGRIAAEPVEQISVEQLPVEQARRGAVEPVLAIVAVAEAVRLT